jgi:hypothetical protein
MYFASCDVCMPRGSRRNRLECQEKYAVNGIDPRHTTRCGPCQEDPFSPTRREEGEKAWLEIWLE